MGIRRSIVMAALFAAPTLLVAACASGKAGTDLSSEQPTARTAVQVNTTQQNQGNELAPDGRVRIVVGQWPAEDQAAFREVVAAWERETGGKVETEIVPDLATVLRTRIEGGAPPDIAILPNASQMTSLATDGKIQPLDTFLDMEQFRHDYSKTWESAGSAKGKLYGLVIRVTSKDTVWYSPREFQSRGWQVPQVWDELLQLSDDIAKTGTSPWSVGMESQSTSGWPGSDWFQELYLKSCGPERYDMWVRHQLPWTDQSVKGTFQSFGHILHAEAWTPNGPRSFIHGGPSGAIATNWRDASRLPFQNPPKAFMYFQGAFVQPELLKQFPQAKAGQDYDFFGFPDMNPEYSGAITGEAEMATLITTTEASKSLMRFMSQAKVWEPWIKRGGLVSPNKSIDRLIYPDPVAQKLADQLADPVIFRLDANDQMPAKVQQAERRAILDYLRNPSELDIILRQMEAIAEDAYHGA